MKTIYIFITPCRCSSFLTSFEIYLMNYTYMTHVNIVTHNFLLKKNCNQKILYVFN